MTDEYQPDQLFRTAVPQWKCRDDGTWIRDWEIRLVDAADAEHLVGLERLGGGGIQVVAIVSSDRRTLRLETATRLNPYTDEVFYAAAYRMLRSIDEYVGRIELIQGQPRDAWQPFRTSKSGS
jgi:hypothetical protein